VFDPSAGFAAVSVFASTNADDLILLAAFFSDSSLSPRAIVCGQLLGIGTLVLLSVAAGLAAMTVPAGYTALLGVVPVILGTYIFWQQRHRRPKGAELGATEPSRPIPITRARPLLLVVAGTTIANGGDNLSIYVPLFASEPTAIPSYVAVFTGMTCL